MSRRRLTEEERRRRWAAIKKAAMEYHDHYQERGLGVLIAADAGVTPQSVSDWKRGVTTADEAQIMRLATKYGVSSQALSGEAMPADEKGVRYEPNDEYARRVHELTGAVTSEVMPEGSFEQFQAISKRAHELILEGRDDDSAYGALFRFVKSMKKGETPTDLN